MKTPYFTISKSIALEKYKIVENITDVVSYSSKTNPIVTPILEEKTNCMFSVHLVNELKNIKDKSRVIYLAQGINNDLLCNLLEEGVSWFVVDNEVDLDIILNYNTEKKINLLLRLKLKEHSIRTEKYYVFGMYSQTIAKRINEISKNKNNINKLGIHFHRKSQNMSEWNLKYELENTFNDDFWKQIDIVNIGGGIPSKYANTNVNVFQSIFNKITELKNWFNHNNIQMIIEPGRFISAPAGKLHTTIIGIHENTIIVDASVYNGDLDALVVPVKLLVENEKNKDDTNKQNTYIIKGITPCSMDIFRYRVYLEKQNVGDKVVFLNAGAYNFASDFCDQEKVHTKVIE